MSRFNTGNQIPSISEEDAYDNMACLDQAMNSTDPSWRDRFNVEKPTIDAALKSAGFMPAGFDFVTGGTLQPGDRNKAVYNPAPNGDNNWYRWNGVFPKEIAANSQPNPKNENNWVLAHFRIGIVEKEALRRTYLEAGYNLVDGSFEVGGTLVNANDVLLQERTGKAFSGPAGDVAAGTNPTLPGSGYASRKDVLLRNELAAPGGAGLVGFQQSGTGAVARTAESKLREIVSIKDFGAKGDGVTDDTAAKNAMISALGYLVVPEGVFMVDTVACDGVVVGIFGTNRLKSILKSLPGSHTHTVEVSNDGGAVIRNITIDQNESAQTGGHGIRSAGCSILDISNATIKNCKGYGIGLQAGTAKGVKIDNVLIDNTGSDGIDVKDYNFDNDVIQINNLTVTNYGRASSKQTAVDIRGPVNLTNLVAISTYPDTRAFRLRSGTVQGRPGSGTASNIYFKGQDGSSYAVQISNDVKDYTIHGVEAEGCGLIAIFGDGSEGYVTGLVGRNLLTEGCSIYSTGLTIDGLIVSGVASRAVDFEPTSRNNRITNFKFSGVGSADFVRIQSGSQNNQMVNGMVEYGKTPSVFAGTNATIQNVTNFKTLYKGISDNILVDSVATKTFVFTHGLGSTSGITPDLSSIRTQVVAATSGGQNAELGPVFINAITSTQIEIVLKVITPSPTPGAAVKVAIEASKYNGHP